MEELFFSGDIIVVNKLAYGPKLPQSPFDIPWLNVLFYFNKKAKARIGEEWWPYYRFAGYSTIQHGDVLIFQFDDLFVTKRCLALPSDTIAMMDGKVFINHKEYVEPTTVKNDFLVEVKDDHKFYWRVDSLGICCIVRRDSIPHRFVGNFSYQSVGIIKALPEVKSIHLLVSAYDFNNLIFVNSLAKRWTLDNMGPLVVPQKGMKISLTKGSFSIYEKVLKDFEKAGINQKAGECFINHKKVTTYTFKQDYYFVLGDNRKSSDDSRVIGFVPYKKIIGKVQGKLYSSHTR